MTRKANTTRKARLSDAPVGSLVAMPGGGFLRNGGPNRGGSGRPPEIIRARSRAMYELILDEIVARNLSEATLGELATLGNTTGRYGGMATVDVASITTIGRLHIDALRAPREHLPLPQGVQRALMAGTDDAEP